MALEALSPLGQLDITHLIAIAAALGWASGLRLYAVVFLTGAAGYMGWIPLPSGLQALQNPLVLGVSFLLGLLEFVADKIPGVDTIWDALHTFIRIPAGAALAASVFGADAGSWNLVAALLGGTLAATPPRPRRGRRPTHHRSRSRTSRFRCWVMPPCPPCCGCLGRTRWCFSRCWVWLS